MQVRTVALLQVLWEHPYLMERETELLLHLECLFPEPRSAEVQQRWGPAGGALPMQAGTATLPMRLWLSGSPP